MKSIIVLATAVLLAGTSAGSSAKSAHAKWMAGPPGLPAGAMFMVVSGDPSKPAMFTIRAKLPANYVVPPHQHPTDERISVKAGGPFAYGMGDKIDRSNAGSIDKGYHVTLAGNMNHWAATTAPTEIEISAMGPFAITYANPADDPRGVK